MTLATKLLTACMACKTHDVFFDYAPHVGWIVVRALKKPVDYSPCEAREYVFWEDIDINDDGAMAAMIERVEGLSAQDDTV